MKTIKKITAILLIVLTLLSVFPTQSYAHDTFFLQSTINEANLSYQLNVLRDDASFFSNESNHTEAKLGDFSGMLSGWSFTSDYESIDTEGKGGDATMPFNFPGIEDDRWTTKKNNATSKDANNAYNVQQILSASLNEAMMILNDGQKYDSVEDFISASEKLASGSSYNGWSVAYSGNEATLSKSGAGSYKLVYRVDKGYTTSGSEYYDSYYNGKDIKYIGWKELIFQANYAYEIKGVTSTDSQGIHKPSTLETKIVEVFENMFTGLRNLLGLYDTNDLVYNEGFRGTGMYYLGVAPKDWVDKSTVFHMTFQAIAWLIIGIAIMKHLAQQNLATINPAIRANLMESVQDLVVTAILLASIFPLINLLLILNNRLVGIFAVDMVGLSMATDVNNYSGELSGILMQAYYFVISIYLNAVYILRAITITILMALAPIFVVGIAFGQTTKQMFSMWLRELIGTIFMQSFHAFALSFFLGLSTSARGIEGAVVAFALIPMTEFFKRVTVGEGGGIASHLGMASVASGMKAAKGAAASTGYNKSASKNSGAGAGGGGSNSSSVGSSDMKQKDSSAIPGANKNGRVEHTRGVPSENSTQSALSTMSEPSYNVSKGSFFDKDKVAALGESTKQHFNDVTGGTSKGAAMYAGGKLLDGIKVAKSVASGTLGAGAALALGGSSNEIGKMGTDMMTKAKADVIPSGVIGGVKNKINQLTHNPVLEDSRAIYKSMKSGTNILGAESLSNGDVAVHRNRNAVEKEGIVDAKMDSGNNAMLSFNSKNMSAEHQQLLSDMSSQYKDEGNHEWMKEQGIEKMWNSDNGNVNVLYNKTGMEHMGIKDIYATSSRIVETKTPYQSQDTSYLYPLRKPVAKPQETKAESINKEEQQAQQTN